MQSNQAENDKMTDLLEALQKKKRSVEADAGRIIRKGKRRAFIQVAIAAILILFFGLLALVAYFTVAPEEMSVIWLFGFFVALGLFLLWRAIKSLRLLYSYPKFYKLFVQTPVCSLEQLAQALKKKPANTQKTLLAMMTRGYFPGGHIDLQTKLVYSGLGGAAPQEEAVQEDVEIACPRCGTVNTVPEQALAVCHGCNALLYKED